ncbi:MAG TPA: bifunctional phosphoribosylaminoimidazolecarboxamide formyltransferase/IMP cyclohydrolase [Candidatus Saccharimonadales bacterium]|nr:bifunctional phosphoribosylaminoimidazolecarboxamide formyltransferase/IMP cyclohydrolase [Candidatus Saccharimonadales bacterium]
MSEIRIGRALLSVSDKTGLADLAAGLARHGVKIVSTGGTAATLRDAGISVRDVGEITGFPELFGGRVKTLHPAVHGGILYRRGNRMDEEERHHHGIVSIELVVVNLYPFEKTVGRAGVSDAEAVEQIDIGGPALIRAAAKNHAHVVTVVDPDQYAEVLEALDRGQGTVPASLARKFARRAYERTSAYDAAIAGYLSGVSSNGAPRALPDVLTPRYRLLQKLRYGENPGQEGAAYAGESGGGIAVLAQLKGKTLSYNNYLDIEAALTLLHEFEEPAAVVMKHRNPSGAAVAPTVAGAIPLARDADALSAFGGILGINRPLDDAALEAIGTIFLEVVVAPSITASPERLEKTRKNLMVLEAPDLLRGATGALATRSLLGGLLAETPPAAPQFSSWMAVTARKPTEAETRDLRFAWRVTRHVISNAIVIARDGVTLGIGAGQSSRVDAVRLALLKAERAGHDVQGAVLCSDAFFPFPDSVELAAKAGITAIAQPGGSVRDEESIAAAESRGLTMLLTGERCFLH